jgi:hypothetical protein
MPSKKTVNITAQMPALMDIPMEQDAVIMGVVVRARNLATPQIFLKINDGAYKHLRKPRVTAP